MNEPLHIDFGEFERQLHRFFDRLRDRNQPVLVEQDGETFRVERERVDLWKGYAPQKADQALQASRGMFAGTAREEFLRELHAQREQGSNRPE